MNKIILILVIIITSKYTQGQSSKTLAGSWINMNVIDYYKSDKDCSCLLKDFENDKFVPLYLSFNNLVQVKISFRIEQEIFTYKVKNVKRDSAMIIRGHNSYNIYLKNGKLKLKFHNRVVTFVKVSDNYSKDVFGEFIRNLIFDKHKSYIIDSFLRANDNNYKNIVFDRINFQEQLKKIFKSKEVEIVQLGTFKFNDSCFPEIAIYYSGEKKYDSPEVLGIIAKDDRINFVDKSGVTVLSLIPFSG